MRHAYAGSVRGCPGGFPVQVLCNDEAWNRVTVGGRVDAKGSAEAAYAWEATGSTDPICLAPEVNCGPAAHAQADVASGKNHFTATYHTWACPVVVSSVQAYLVPFGGAAHVEVAHTCPLPPTGVPSAPSGEET